MLSTVPSFNYIQVRIGRRVYDRNMWFSGKVQTACDHESNLCLACVLLYFLTSKVHPYPLDQVTFITGASVGEELSASINDVRGNGG